ncbi:MAG: TIGR01841 family phasin [Pseudomonadota bacterium]|nr:TIGR01841 family phasin [Pseudomonadota bacterium]
MANKTHNIRRAQKAAAPVTTKAPPATPVATPAAKAAIAQTPAVKTPEAAPAAPVWPIAEAAHPVIETPVTENIVETIPAALTPAAIKKEVTTMETTLKNAADTAANKAQAFFADANDRTKATWEKSQKAFEDMTSFGKGNVEALVESGKIAAKGIEAMGQDAAEYSRKSFESATAALKSFSSVKSPTDLFKLHSDYMRASFDSLVAETSKSTEAMLKLAGEVAQPISNRVAVAVEKVKVAA